MRYGNRSLWRRIISSQLTMFAVLVVFTVLAKATWNIWEKSKASDLKLAQVQTEFEKINTREKSLADQIDHLSTDQGIEAELRTKFRAVKNGESVAVILDDNQASSSSISSQSAAAVLASSNASSTEQSWWQKVLRVFGL